MVLHNTSVSGVSRQDDSDLDGEEEGAVDPLFLVSNDAAFDRSWALPGDVAATNWPESLTFVDLTKTQVSGGSDTMNCVISTSRESDLWSTPHGLSSPGSNSATFCS